LLSLEHPDLGYTVSPRRHVGLPQDHIRQRHPKQD
jgi:hypothetical protein